jgi:hypothetical protein
MRAAHRQKINKLGRSAKLKPSEGVSKMSLPLSVPPSLPAKPSAERANAEFKNKTQSDGSSGKDPFSRMAFEEGCGGSMPY